MDRRDFFERSFQTMLAFAMASCRSIAPVSPSYGKRERIFIALSTKHNTSSFLRAVDLTDFSSEDFPIPVELPHSLIKNSLNPDEIIVLEYFGKAIKLNVVTKEVTQIVQSDTAKFLGHGVQSPDGKYIWCTENLSGKGSFVRARRIEDLSLVEGGNFSFLGGHHVVYLPDSTILATAGGQGTQSKNFINFFDTATGKCNTLYPLNDMLVHLTGISSHEVIGVSSSFHHHGEDYRPASSMAMPRSPEQAYKAVNVKQPAPLYHADYSTKELKSFWGGVNRDLFLKNFGIARIPGTIRSYITSHNLSNKLIFWNGFDVERVMDVERPMGFLFSHDGTRLIVQSDKKLRVYSMVDYKLIKEIQYELPVSMVSGYS